MREQHPIDDHFRQALAGASANPPAGLWAGIAAERERRRVAAIWRVRRNAALLLLAFIGFGTGTYWLNRPTVDQGRLIAHTDNGSAILSERANEGVNSTLRKGTDKAEEGLPASGSGNSSTPITVASEAETAGTLVGTPTPKAQPSIAIIRPGQGVKGEVAATPYSSRTSNKPVDRSPIPEHASSATNAKVEGGPMTTGAAPLTLETSAPGLLAFRHSAPEHTASAQGVLQVARVPQFVLPSADWWIAAQVGLYNTHRVWQGAPSRLTDAMNESEVWNSTIALGGMAGRTWRSGFGFGAGLDWERSEQAFHHLERKTDIEDVVTTNFITLNTVVIYAQYDTTTIATVDERWIDGLDQRTVWRASFEAFWHHNVRRWQFGPRVGMAVEHTRVRSSGSLAYDALDDRIYQQQLAGEALRSRYPTMALGLVGVDLAYALHERWYVGVTPIAMFGIRPIANPSEPYCSPQRLGFRFSIVHTIAH